MEFSLVETIGFGGTLCTVATYSMRTILPLRIAGILSSVFFIAYGLMIQSWPMLVTEFIILPMNVIRLIQLLVLLRQVETAASTNSVSAEWLKPFGRTRRFAVGDVVFNRGDKAEYLLLLETGKFELKEAQLTLGAGEIVGELGFLTPENRRTMTLVCVEAGEVSEVSYFDMKQLYFSNPKFAFYLLRLVSDRLMQNVERAQQSKAVA
jgi:CRP/FNR family cyclic AMP-dependent transcriptional regulator